MLRILLCLRWMLPLRSCEKLSVFEREKCDRKLFIYHLDSHTFKWYQIGSSIIFSKKMNEKIETNKNYETVGDDDVLLLVGNQATFLVRRFKELAASKFSEILGLTAQKESREILIMYWKRELCINEEKIGRA